MDQTLITWVTELISSKEDLESAKLSFDKALLGLSSTQEQENQQRIAYRYACDDLAKAQQNYRRARAAVLNILELYPSK